MPLDAAFIQGNHHTVCEDYACVRDVSFALSDGCSSSESTDLGARLLAEYASLYWPAGQITKAAKLARYTLKRMQRPYEALDATLMLGYPDQDGFRVKVMGDGMVAWMNEGIWDIYTYTWPSNYPYYINYQFHKERLDGWRDKNPEPCVVDFYTWNSITNELVKNDENIYHGAVTHIPIISYDTFRVTDKFEAVVVFSDGIFSTGLRAEEIIPVALDFQNYHEGFIKRHMNRIKRTMKQMGIMNSDDMSMAGLSR